ncbi:MAG: FAD-dependent oxidoreductase [Aquabacterium sp.]
MRVAVVGAGIVGVTSAYELARDGHAVTVFERRQSVAEETSFANAGVVAPGYVTPWAAPGMLWKVLAQMPSRHAAVRMAMPVAPLGWLWRWWRACSPGLYAGNRAAMCRLALYSQQLLHERTAELRLDFERGSGYLVLLRGNREVAGARASLVLLADLGVKASLVDAAQARTVEPGLAEHTALAGAIHLPASEVGNCRQFAHLLRQEAQRLGVDFRFGRRVLAVEPGTTPRLRHVPVPVDGVAALVSRSSGDTSTPPMDPTPSEDAFEAVVMCTALDAIELLRPIGIQVPLAAIHGYSVTLPLKGGDAILDQGPRSGLMDERYKVAITRLGQRLRVAGGAEVGGRLQSQSSRSIATLYKVLQDWFPGVVQQQAAQVWKGARPMLPDGPPVVCRAADGLWLNLGHGSSGWALSCGSARLLADLVARRTGALDARPFDLQRFAR